MIRLAFTLTFAVLIVMLIQCGLSSFRSKKHIGKYVGFLCYSLIPAVLGNMIVIFTSSRTIAFAGYHLYYIGMDLILFSLINFTYNYCPITRTPDSLILPVLTYFVLFIDVIQIISNPIFGHAFSIQEIEAFNAPYYIVTAASGLIYHRIVDYAAIAMIMLIYIITCIKVPRIYRERYTVILLSLILGAVWKTYYIFSRTPIDRSMVGFSLFGFMVYYFSLYYRPLRLLDRMLAEIVSYTQEAVFLFDPVGKCIWINTPAKELVKTEDNDKAKAELVSLFGSISSIPFETDSEYTLGEDENAMHYILSRGNFLDNNQKNIGSYVRVKDITSEKRRIEREIFATNHDALTGVYTKEYTFKKISDKLLNKELKGYYIASIHICDFKMYNDVYGREFGDYALMQIVDWLKKYSDERCIYGRIDGDTFGSCLPIDLFSAEILEEDLSDFKVKTSNTEHHIGIHIGLYSIEDTDRDVSVMFDRALLALDSIKDNYKKHVAFFDKKLRDKVVWNQELTAQLKPALERNQIFPYLQPIVDRGGKVVGAEALVRWIHPIHGFMSPGEFIPLFEENGMIVDLDRHIWESACKILQEWKQTHPELFISVNISPNDFYLTDVLAEVRNLVRKYEIDPHKLRVEVTETVMMQDTDDKMQVLDDFRKLGFIVEMDDFGSGYSSLNMLKDMPVDILKIDMKFLGKTDNIDRANIIIKNIIELAEDLGITTLTEGVETKEQFDMLNSMGCILFQGYYFSKPVPRDDYEKLL